MSFIPISGGSPRSLPYTIKNDAYSSHAQISQLVSRRAQVVQLSPYVVLDVGCAYGFLRPFLPAPQYRLLGVDRSKEAVLKSREIYDEVYEVDVLDPAPLPFGSGMDSIVFGDVLEHLPDPSIVLRRIIENSAKPGTQVIISLPNVAHLYVRLNLLMGRFQYADRGILDRTHLRFFTLLSARELVESCGLLINAIRVTSLPLPLLNPIFGDNQPLAAVHKASFGLAKVFKNLLGYQFVIEAYVGHI